MDHHHCPFHPGGRTATTYVAGTVGMPWKRRFLPADSVAVVLWALYASALGYLGGASFENNLWLPMLIGAGASLLVGAIGELLRRKVLDPRIERGRTRPGSEIHDARHAPRRDRATSGRSARMAGAAAQRLL